MVKRPDPFSHATWTANSEITICNVPWNADYRDIYRAPNQVALNSYIDGLESNGTRLVTPVQLKFGEPISLDIPYNQAIEYNYLRVTNARQPIPGDKIKSFYYFIQHVEYVSPNNTRFWLQVDAVQTFIYDTRFGNCYVERGHLGIANTKQFDNYGRDYLTVPEGMDVGGEYQIVDKRTKAITRVQDSIAGASVGYRVMVVSTVALDKDYGTIEKPLLNSATGSMMQHLPNGSEIYLFNAGSELQRFLKAASDKPWITQGIISIQAIPRDYAIPVTSVTGAGVTFDKVQPGALAKVKYSMYNNWRDNVRVLNVPYRYRSLKKFLTYPYCVLELTSYSGTPLLIKPESWNDNDATVVEMPHFAPPNPRMAFYPFRYNAADTSGVINNANGVFNDGGEFLDMATGISNFPTFSTVNNSYAAFLASQSNSIAFQHSSADWSQQKALTGAQLAQSQSGMGIAASQDLNSIGINASMASTALQNETLAKSTMLGAAGSIASGIAMGPAGIAGGVGSAITQGLGAAIQADSNNQQMGISTGASRDSNSRSNSLTGQIADSNKGYADMAAQGDYANAIAGINAKVQDAKLIQPTTSGQMGGESFLLANYQWGYDLKVKLMDSGAMRTLGEFWLRYGYNVNTFYRMPESLMCMTNFTYWKLKETYILSSKCPEEYRQTLRGIFEKGVTVWSNPNDIGRIDTSDNTPLGGISY